MEELNPMWWLQDLKFNPPRVVLVDGVQWTVQVCLLLAYLKLLRLSESTSGKVFSMVATEDLGRALTRAEVSSKQS